MKLDIRSIQTPAVIFAGIVVFLAVTGETKKDERDCEGKLSLVSVWTSSRRKWLDLILEKKTKSRIGKIVRFNLKFFLNYNFA